MFHNVAKVLCFALCSLLPMVAIVHSMKTTQAGQFRLRSFDASRDQASLESMCRNVYGGKDYLPRMAARYASDPSCRFRALVDENDLPLAVANLRVLDETSHWLEGVRVSEQHRNTGLGEALVRSMVHDCCEGRKVLACTVRSNQAMRRVFAKVGMNRVADLRHVSTRRLEELPGWSVGDEETPQTLLSARNLEHLVPAPAKECLWKVVTTEAELNSGLQDIRRRGGCGYFPGYWEVISPHQPSLRESLRDGRVWTTTTRGGDTTLLAVLRLDGGFAAPSIQSRWLVSVASTTNAGLQAALWRASSPEGRDAMGGDAAFVLALDGAIPTDDGPFFANLGLEEDRAILYEHLG